MLSLTVVPSLDKWRKNAWAPADYLGSASSQGRSLQWSLPWPVPTLLLIFLRVSSLCVSCLCVPPRPHGAALWPWLCGDFMKTFLQLVEGGGHMGWSSEEIGVGFLFSLWLRHVGEHFCRILIINNLFTYSDTGETPQLEFKTKGTLILEVSVVVRTRVDSLRYGL